MNTGIVLAAGMSTRMGEPKALVRWGDEPLLVYQVQQLLEAGCDEVIVVLGHQADLIHRELRRVKCRVMLNARFHAGRSGSVRIGAKAANRDTESILVIGVDQPRPAAFLKRLLDAHSPDFAATRPVHDGRHGHPVVLSGRLRAELMSVQDDD
jgi:CTP:molybdopterin cytidylyltransferase MocA